MNTIKNILIINLNRRNDLLEKIKYIFEFINDKYDINIERIEGIDIKKDIEKNPLLFNTYIFDNIISFNTSGLRENKKDIFGEIGCYLAHKKCWEKIISNKLENTLILEDGIIFHKDKFDSNIKFNKDYDIIYTNKEMTENNNILTGYGLQAYILSNKGATKLLTYCNTLYFPIDIQLRNLCNSYKLNWYVNTPYLTENNYNKISSISNGKYQNINYNEKQNTDSIIVRIIKNMIKNNIPLINYI